MGKQLELFSKADVPFVNEVEIFNRTFGKPNKYEPTIPEEKEWQFVYDFVLEELEEYRQACENGNIVEVLDALCDIAYVSLGNGTMLHGLKIRYGQHIKKYKQVICRNLVALKKRPWRLSAKEVKNKMSHVTLKKSEERFVVYRTRDRKVMKSINYFRPDLKQFFTEKRITKIKP
jgi:hypothetical protein